MCELLRWKPRLVSPLYSYLQVWSPFFLLTCFRISIAFRLLKLNVNKFLQQRFNSNLIPTTHRVNIHITYKLGLSDHDLHYPLSILVILQVLLTTDDKEYILCRFKHENELYKCFYWALMVDSCYCANTYKVCLWIFIPISVHIYTLLFCYIITRKLLWILLYIVIAVKTWHHFIVHINFYCMVLKLNSYLYIIK